MSSIFEDEMRWNICAREKFGQNKNEQGLEDYDLFITQNEREKSELNFWFYSFFKIFASNYNITSLIFEKK